MTYLPLTYPARALALTLAIAMVAGACTPRPTQPRAPVVDRTQPPTSPANPRTGLTTQPIRPADGNGIVTYDGYQAAIAQQGDTVATVADRIGLSASALGSYNGLDPNHALRAGDELALPPRQGGYGASGASLSAPTTGTAGPRTVPITTAPIQTTPLDGSASTATAAATPAATEGGTGWSPSIAEAAIDRATGLNADGTLAAPPSAAAPLPPEPRPARALQSPDLSQYQTGAAATPAPAATAPAPPQETQVAAAPATAGVPRLSRPVPGPVAIGFNKGAGPAKNDGVDFAAAAGTPVKAAADGTVALVSQSLGGLGTIVLLRHPNDYLTVYGRVANVTVAKGDIVRAGQTIGAVSDAAAPAEPRLHFELRRGAESIDPMPHL